MQRAPELIGAAASRFGGLDLLVNCAGATKRGDFFGLPHQDFLDGFALKFFGAVELTRAAWPHLRKAGAGHVVNIIGAGARTPSADFTIGGSVNSALENFTKAMADRGHQKAPGQRCPSRPDRDRAADPPDRRGRGGEGGGQAEARARMIKDQRVVRFGRPDEVAELVVFMD